MATKSTESKPIIVTDRSDRSLAHVALDVADRSKSTAFAVLQDARVELRAAADGSIELAEKLAAGALRFAKKLVSRIDDASNEALAGTERLLASAVKHAREPSDAAAAA